MALFQLGINYWPRSSAMEMWSRFDPTEIDDDFARIAGMGLGLVRFFLRWDVFQPAHDTISQEALDRCVILLDRAQEHGLRTIPTLFCGHVSGANWLPAWTLDPAVAAGDFPTITEHGPSPHGIGDFYGGELLDAQRLFARTLGERVREHPALLAWDLGNAFTSVREPRSIRDAAHWSTALAHDLTQSSHAVVTGGLQSDDITNDLHLRPSSVAELWQFASMHGESVASSIARNRLDPEVVPFLSALTAACARKPVLVTGLGDLAGLSDEEMAAYARKVLDRLQHRGALGALWWCWADYPPEMASAPPFDRAPQELTYGVVRSDGSAKPIARILEAFAREGREVAEAGPAIVDESHYYAGLPASLPRAYEAYVAAHNFSEEIS
jgi:endo-1,4-beta-mannosidase